MVNLLLSRVPRDLLSRTPPGPEGSNGSELLSAQWVTRFFCVCSQGATRASLWWIAAPAQPSRHLIRRMQMRAFGVLLMFGMIAPLGKAQSHPAQAGLPSCRFTVPADLPAGTAEWIGNCSGGKADGLGVIRVPHAGTAAVFYGRMRSGFPVAAVMQQSPNDSYLVANSFDQNAGTVSISTEMDESVKLFHQAAQAARLAGEHYARLGNRTSAAFYRSMAGKLDEQFDH